MIFKIQMNKDALNFSASFLISWCQWWDTYFLYLIAENIFCISAHWVKIKLLLLIQNYVVYFVFIWKVWIILFQITVMLYKKSYLFDVVTFRITHSNCLFYIERLVFLWNLLFLDLEMLHIYVLDSLVVQMVKNLPSRQETRFNPWVGKMPWRREWQPTPVFLPGEFHGQKSLVDYSP